MTKLAVRTAGVALLLLLAACSGPSLPGVPRSRTSPPPSAPAAPTPGSIEAFVPAAASFVESHRGLRFKRQIKVSHLSDAEFQQRIVALQRRDRAETDRQGKLFRALGLVDPGVDVEKAEEDLLGSGVVGYYDPKTKELMVRGDRATAAVRHVVVHELTHALQDQWFSLDTDQGNQTEDQALAYVSLVEGDAVRIEREYVASLSTAERQQLDAGGGSGPPASVPAVLTDLLAFPYVAGPPFASAVVRAQGQAALDKAFKERPAATSQVIEPDLFLGGEQPQQVTEPPADGQVLDRGVLGEAQLAVLLKDHLRSSGSRSDANRVSRDWAGDRYVAWSDGGSYCIRVRYAARSQDGSAALSAALQQLAGPSSGVQVQAGAEPVLTSCG